MLRFHYRVTLDAGQWYAIPKNRARRSTGGAGRRGWELAIAPHPLARPSGPRSARKGTKSAKNGMSPDPAMVAARKDHSAAAARSLFFAPFVPFRALRGPDGLASGGPATTLGMANLSPRPVVWQANLTVEVVTANSVLLQSRVRSSTLDVAVDVPADERYQNDRDRDVERAHGVTYFLPSRAEGKTCRGQDGAPDERAYEGSGP